MSDTLFDVKETDKENEDKDPLNVRERLFLNKYIENLASNVKGSKVRAYMWSFYDGDTPESSPERYHGARVTAVDVWRSIEKKMGFQKLAHEMGLDNWALLGKLKELMEVQRPMMRKTETGEQEAVFYADGPVQLKATTTLISLANELANETGTDRAPTLNITFAPIDNWENAEIQLPKKPDEL